MSSMDEIIINLACLDEEIVPFCGTEPGYVVQSLEGLSLANRRKATRKFRKLLKRAIHEGALFSGARESIPYSKHAAALKRLCGLTASPKRVFRNPHITSAQSRWRAKLVIQYLRKTIKI